jgi:hypothetical protein
VNGGKSRRASCCPSISTTTAASRSRPGRSRVRGTAVSVGWTYVTDDEIRKEYGVKRISKKTRAKATALLEIEVKTYDQYLTGDVYGYVVKDPDGNCVESCWGFFGGDDVKQEATSVAKHCAEKVHEAQARAIEATRPDMYPPTNGGANGDPVQAS